MSLKTLKTFFFWMTVINFLILLISTFGVVALTQEMKAIHSRIFHVSPDELSQIYFEYLAWYKLLWMIFEPRAVYRTASHARDTKAQC